MNRPCPPPEKLRQLAAGQLTDQVADEVSAHLLECPQCQTMVATTGGADPFVDAIRNLAQGAEKLPAPLDTDDLVRVERLIANHREPGRAVDHAPKASEVPTSSAGLDATFIPPDAARFHDQWDADVSDGLGVDSADLPPALRNHQDYHVLRKLGQGGMGIVYLVRNLRMDRLEALKVITASLADRPGTVDRFEREIRSAARLNHPHIVTAYSAPRLEGLIAFTMEFVDGVDLHELVKANGPLPIPDACNYISQAASALQHAHDRQMVHRDIKPNNLMLAREGQTACVKVMDFGLAKVTSEQQEGNLTGEGVAIGTPYYIAPEQIRDATRADIRADIYSLGGTLRYLLTGHPPFPEHRHWQAALLAHQYEEPPPLEYYRADIPHELSAVIARMLAKDPAARYQQPVEVSQALAIFTQPGIHAKALPSTRVAVSEAAHSAAERGPRDKLRSRVHSFVGLGLTAIAILLAVIFLPTKYGVLQIDIADPSLSVKFDDQSVTIDNNGQPLRVSPTSKHTLAVQLNGTTVDGGTREITLSKGEHRQVAVSLIAGHVAIDGKLVAAPPTSATVPAAETAVASVPAATVAKPTIPTSIFERERAALQRVLELGGSATITLPTGPMQLTSTSPIPLAGFHCLGIKIEGNVSADGMDLFAGLPLLDAVSIFGDRFSVVAWGKIGALKGLRTLSITKPLPEQDFSPALAELAWLRTISIQPRTLQNSPGFSKLSQLRWIRFYFAKGQDLALLKDLSNLKAVIFHDPAGSIDETVVQSFQEAHPSTQIVFGPPERARYLGKDLWTDQLRHLLRKGVRVYNSFSPPSSSLVTEEQLNSGVPVLVGVVQIPPEAELDDAVMDFIVNSPVIGFTGNGHSKVGEFLYRLAVADHLTSVHLKGAPLRDEQLMPLEQMPRLGEINLTGTGVSAQAVESLTRALPYCRIYSDYGLFNRDFDRE